MRIEKVGRNRVVAAVSSLRPLGIGEEKKMRFRGGEVVFHKLIIRYKTTNVAGIDLEKVRGGIKASGVDIRRAIHPVDFFGPQPSV